MITIRYIGAMKRSKQGWAWLAATVLLTVACVDVRGDAKTNPYDSIVDRNPFGLKPPPPPDPDAGKPPPPPPAPLAAVELTGITSILSSKRALLEIVPGPGKPMLKPILAEGERVESVEVVSINVDKNEVVIKNGTVTTNLTFKVAKASAPAPPSAGGVPPAAHPAAVPQPAQTSYNQNYGGSGRNNVMVAGGSSPVAPTAGTPAYGGANNAAASSSANAPTLSGGNTDGGFRSIPSRKILSNTATPQGAPQMSPEEQVIHMEAQRQLNKNSPIPTPPLPITPLTPLSDLQGNSGYPDNSGYQNNASGRPWVPRNTANPFTGK
jgi:hypothetical protein